MDIDEGKQRLYFSSRKGSKEPISLAQAQKRLETLYLLYRDANFFSQKLGTNQRWQTSDTHKRLAEVKLGFSAFPIVGWAPWDLTEDHIFDVVEFLFDHVSKPGEWNFDDECYESFDEIAGKSEFRS